MKILDNKNIDFIKIRKICYFISFFLIVIGIVSVVLHKGLKYTIEFTGGVSIEIGFLETTPENSLNIEKVREVLSKNGISDVEIQEITSSNSILIKTKLIENELIENVGNKILMLLITDYPHLENKVEIRSTDAIGPKAGADLREKAVISVLISLVFILIYIGFRFRLVWGLIAAFALFHDVLITIGFLSILNKEIGMTVLAALLTIVGYSINNTIVIFDRIKNDQKIYRKENDYQIINRSISSVLNRTILTSFTTILANVTLIIFGGPVIFDFGIAFLIGTVVGTFSSIFVAPTLLFDLLSYKNFSKNSRF
jgi:preprotein translocase SecF subunit